jgi:hypothetical protein
MADDKIFRKRTGDYVPRTTVLPPLNGADFEDHDFVQATEVQTEYERGYEAGVASREELAEQVMQEAERTEMANERLRTYYGRLWFALFVLAALDLIWLLP